MSDPLTLPAGVQTAFDNNVPYFTVVEFSFAQAQGGVRRWTTDSEPTSWELSVADGGDGIAKTWSNDNPLNGLEFQSAAQNSEGHVVVSLFDVEKNWERLFRSAGPRGLDCRIVHLQPYGNNLLYELNLFEGVVSEIQHRHPFLKVSCEDAFYFAKFVQGEWTSDEFQRDLSATDNSHILAHTSRRFVFHGVR